MPARGRGPRSSCPFCGTAIPSGPCDAASFQAMCDRVLADLGDSVDAVMLDLHGAMVAEGADDAEGALLEAIRARRPGIPIAVALDFHATISRQTVENADVITGYRSFPHTDMHETGQRAATTLPAWLNDGPRPVMVFEWLPMLPATALCTPAGGAMKPVMDRTIAAEAGGEVLNALVFGSFPLSDVPQAGACVITVARDAGAAADVAQERAAMLWDAREGFVLPPQDFGAVIRQAVGLNGHPVIIGDPGNNAGSGGSADTPAVLEALLAAGVDGTLAGPVYDPESVQAMITAGTGAEVEIALGGKVDLSAAGIPSRPLRLKGRVGAITDGRSPSPGRC
ncbi:MAG: M81 family metallopeptidase [Pararhodobacter sp.]|nr:M81 family metallopeptidase [Pararhodobacter sp.]